MNKQFLSTHALRFRRFSNKAYAAFNSIHRHVTIGRLSRALCDRELLKSGGALVCCLLMSASGVALAGEVSDVDSGHQAVPNDSLHLSLQEVQVVSQQTEVHQRACRLVSTLEVKDLQSLPSLSLADWLQYLPSVDVRSRGANGAQTDVSLRGGTFDQVQVLINGVSLSDAQTGHYQFNLPVSMDMVERIEVLQGGNVGLSGAFSGAINIITRQSDSTANSIRFTAGYNQLLSPDWVGQWRKGNWRISTSATYSRSDGYYAPSPTEKEATAAKNSDCQWANLFLRTTYKGLDMQLGAQYKDAGIGMGYGSSLDQFDATRTGFFSAKYHHQWNAFSLDAQAAYRINHDRYEWHRGTVSNRHLTQNATAALAAHYVSRIGTTTLGAEVRNENIRSTNLRDTNRVNVHYYAEQTFHYRGFSASLGAGGHYNTFFGHNVTGNANIRYAFQGGGSIFCHADRAVRMPTFTDLYYKAGSQRGNANLRAEKAWTVSLGGDYHHNWGKAGQLQLMADAYYRWGENIIDWVYSPTDSLYHATNQQNVNSVGGEVSVSYRLNQWLRCVRVDYAYTHLFLDLKETQSRYLDYLRHKFIVRIDHGIYAGLGAAWTVHFEDRMGQYNNAEGAVCDYAPVWLLDGQIYYDIAANQTRTGTAVRIALEANNMSNRHYYSYGGILQPGIWPRLNVQVRF